MSSLVLLWNGLLISCLMVYSNDGPCIIIWDTDLHTGERKQELKGGPHDVFSLRQLSNGQLASDSANLLSDYGTPDKGECQKVLKGHTYDVGCIAERSARFWLIWPRDQTMGHRHLRV